MKVSILSAAKFLHNLSNHTYSPRTIELLLYAATIHYYATYQELPFKGSWIAGHPYPKHRKFSSEFRNKLAFDKLPATYFNNEDNLNEKEHSNLIKVLNELAKTFGTRETYFDIVDFRKTIIEPEYSAYSRTGSGEVITEEKIQYQINKSMEEFERNEALKQIRDGLYNENLAVLQRIKSSDTEDHTKKLTEVVEFLLDRIKRVDPF